MKSKKSAMVMQYSVLLVSRIILLGICVTLFIVKPAVLDFKSNFDFSKGLTFINAVWLFLICNLLPQAFSKKMGSMGFRKQFKENYIQRSERIDYGQFVSEAKFLNRGAIRVFLIYGSLIAIIWVLYLTRIIGESILLLICVGLYVSDLICVLIYCPFQHLLMRNKCCRTCRIFNWDAVMTYAPFLVCPCPFTYSLLGFALFLFIKWELEYSAHPERYLQTSNCAMDCGNCNELFCKGKAFGRISDTTRLIEEGKEFKEKF